jgi:hypothetical protein
VTPEPPLTPFAVSARYVDFAHDTLSNKTWSVGRNNFTNEFMAWCTRETVVTTL